MEHNIDILTQYGLNPYINRRDGETKLGERVHTLIGFDAGALASSAARFVLLGIPEDIGVRANGGIGGAATAWQGFLKSFLNLQDNNYLSGNDFLMLGTIGTSSINSRHKNTRDLAALREATAEIDEMVYPVVREIIAAGKTPLVIGGGHNNAYGLIKGSSLALHGPVNALNLDAHADFRSMEGRHSGNGFRYALQEGLLHRYAMLGLHEGYNSADVVRELIADENLLPLFWEDIFLRCRYDWENALAAAINFAGAGEFGVELDLDSIAGVLSSAATPLGITPTMAANYLYQCGRHPRSIYLHLTEGVTERADGAEDFLTGKLISYLVQAYAKGVLERDK